VSASFASTFSLSLGDGFALLPSLSADADQAEYFVVGAVVNQFPTLYDPGRSGYLIADAADLIAAANTYSPGSPPINGADEFWMRTSADPIAANARTTELANPDLFIQSIVDRSALEASFRADALSSGMSGVLYAGAVTAALLAILGSLTQAQSVARRRLVQFSVLRTLGAGRGELANVLLGEQAAVYAFGLAGGTLLGLALSTASLPYMEYGSTLADPSTVNVPPPIIALNVAGMAIFYAALLLALALSLAWGWTAARRSHLDRALRLDDL
jgi:ABC-type antimicrobial peptide transport system permease subunit